MNAFFIFFTSHRDAIVFSTVLLVGYASAYTQREITRERFKTIHIREYLAPSERENPKDRYMCNRCWSSYPCSELKMLGIKK